MPINFIDELKTLNSGKKTPEHQSLELVLAILKRKLDRTIKENDNKLLTLYLQKLNPLLLSNSIYKDSIALRLLKIDTAKEIKKIISEYQDFFQSDELQEFAKSILQQTAKPTGFQKDLHSHLESELLSGILSGYVSVAKEGVVIDEKDDIKTLVGTGDIVITITDPQTKKITQFVIECDGASHAKKDDSRRNTLLKKSCGDRFLIISHSSGFEEYLRADSTELTKLNNFIKKIKDSDCFKKVVETRKNSSSLQPIKAAETARSSNQFKALAKKEEEDGTGGAEQVAEEEKDTQKKKGKKSKKITTDGNDGDLAMAEAIIENQAIEQEVKELLEKMEDPETKQTAIDTLIKSAKEKDFSGCFQNQFKNILNTNTKIALDILCEVSTNTTLQDNLFELAKDDIKKMLHYGIHHHLFDQKEFIKKIYPTLKSSSGEISAILDCISQNIKFKSFINELDVLIPKEDRDIMSITSKLIILSITNHANIENLIKKSYKEKEIPLVELFLYLYTAFSSENINAFNLLKKHLPEEVRGTGSSKIDLYPLFVYAIFTKQLDVCKLLLEKTEDINLQNIKGESLLYIACHANLSDIVKLLLEKGADANLKNQMGDSPLIAACLNDSASIVKLLLEHNADVASSTQDENTTPLMIAIDKGNLDIVKLLLEKNPASHVNLRDKEGLTSLMLAVYKMLKIQTENKTQVEDEKKYLEIILLLLKKGADPTINKENQQSPLKLMKSMKELKPKDEARNVIYREMLRCVQEPSLTLEEVQAATVAERESCILM